jgi:DNA-binding SARP family transcriptional activator
MRFTLLGPVTAHYQDVQLPIGKGRPQKILAALLLDANRLVSTDRLIEVIWNGRPPRTARQQTQNSIGLLKTALTMRGGEVGIRRESSAYALEIDEGWIDSVVFQRECDQAQEALRLGELELAARRLKTALGRWQGAALHDIDSALLEISAGELEERRLRAIQALVGIRFQQGRHAEMIGDLTVWATFYPYHEELQCTLAQALHQGSRTGEALRVLSALRMRLDSELNISPCAAARELEHQLAGSRSQPSDLGATGMRELIEALRDVTRQLSAVTRALTEQPALSR